MSTTNKNLSKTKLVGLVLSATTMIALVGFALYIMVGIYPDVLVTAQDRNAFAGDAMYFSQQTARPFGLLQYIGGYLTQYFYNPVVGAVMLIVIWAASAFAGIKAFRLKGIWRSVMIVPLACLLTSEVDLGYWVYCLNLTGYWFAQSVAFLCLMLLLWAANSTPRRYRMVWYVVVGLVCFPVLGWVSYLFSICLALSQFTHDGGKRSMMGWIDAAGITVTVIAPLVFRAFLYDQLADEEIFTAGFPFFKTSTDESTRPVIPFYVLVGTTLLMSLGRVLPALRKVPTCIAYIVVGIGSAYGVWTLMFKDMNYLYEIQMTQATMNDDWQRVIQVAEQTRTPSRTMVMLKNIALLNTGELDTRSYELSNDGMEMYNPDSLNINTMHIASAPIYYNHGLVNYATRWCIEFGVPYGFSPYQLKTMARCAKVTGEEELAAKYLARLHKLTFYKDWQPAPVTPVVKELYAVAPDELDNDNNSCERYIISHFSGTHHGNSRYYSELSMLYSTIIRSSTNIWTSFYDYLLTHKGKDLPVQYQEAYILFSQQVPVDFPLQVKINPETVERFKEFWNVGNGYAQSGLDENAVREMMRDEWATTYWWFNSFGRNKY